MKNLGRFGGLEKRCFIKHEILFQLTDQSNLEVF